MSMVTRTCVAAMLLACALAGGGCRDDDDGVIKDDMRLYPVAETPTQLMLNFRDLHRRMDFTELLTSLSGDCTFALNQTAVNLYHLPGAEWNRDRL